MGVLENQGGSEALTKERRVVLEDLWRAYREEERVWRQKSRVRWLKEGDRNTKLFHRVCKLRTVKKNITQLQYRGRLLTSPVDIKEAMQDHFENFFRVADVSRPWFYNENLQKVSDDDLLNFFNDFYHTGRMSKGLNSTFIALIPKGGQQEEISDYRPISLIGSVYKLLSKVLSVRLSLVLPRLLTRIHSGSPDC
ncbi:uncharacterized protein LOC130736453 [Lotus japonicus]|uniref:uncharacterized protein LOC130736453 n=1 Tax=Lotus japonicus TaxID=34305 RepID=UPI0025888696|nr:uncharacterized protein LOC130736453 [Lotus japonicus]